MNESLKQEPAESFLNRYISDKDIAKLLGVGRHFVQKRMADLNHPEHMPNYKVGRKRWMTREDFHAWMEQRKTPLDHTDSRTRQPSPSR